jgi:hypothetical protein
MTSRKIMAANWDSAIVYALDRSAIDQSWMEAAFLLPESQQALTAPSVSLRNYAGRMPHEQSNSISCMRRNRPFDSGVPERWSSCNVTTGAAALGDILAQREATARRVAARLGVAVPS